MLNIKKVFLIAIFLFSLGTVFSISAQNNCNFDVYNTDCERFATSFVNFSLSFDNSNDFLDYEVIGLYNKENQNNKLLVEKIPGTNKIRNINPFTEPGVYILKIKTINKGKKVSQIYNFSFIFDNTQPLPPQVPMNINLSDISGTVEIAGLNVFAKVNGGSEISTNSNNIQNTFNFSSSNLNLEHGLNYIEFYTKNPNQIKSESIGRIIYNGGYPTKNLNPVSNIIINSNLERFNERTINNNNIYTTTKRDFYIQGTATGSEGSIVYINGIETLISNGKFGAFFLLNEGENKIVAENLNSTIKSEITVNYFPLKFMFTDIDIDKIIKGNSFNFVGKTNMNAPFNIYLNGELKNTITPTNNEFSYTINGLNPGKNYLYLEGYNNAKYSRIIYSDTKNPKIEVLSFTNISNSQNFVFKITDDLGIDLNSLSLNINGMTYTNSNIDKKYGIFSINLSNFNDNNYIYSISVKDKVGNLAEFTGSININSNNLLIKSFKFSENPSYIIGNTIFVKNGINTLTLTPSNYIAFKSIKLDGFDITNYHFNNDGTVVINIDFTKEKGFLELSLLNSAGKSTTIKYKYITDSESPKIKFDYIKNPYSNNINPKITITGEIIDSNFDWSSFNINSKSVTKFGNYFEVNIEPKTTTPSLDISGNDYSNNGFNLDVQAFENILLKKDLTKTQITPSSKYMKNSFLTSMSNFDQNIKNYIYSWDKIDSKGNYIKSSTVNLPLNQRDGLRELKLKGFEESGNKMYSNQVFSLDSKNPEIYLIEENSEYKVLIDSTFSPLDSINMTSNGIPISISSTCNNTIAVFSTCILIESNFDITHGLKVTAKDKAGNMITKFFSNAKSISDILPVNPITPKIYFSGNNLITSKSNIKILGNVKSSNPITSVKIANSNCDFDDSTFICDAVLQEGLNNITIDVNSQGYISSKNITIKLIDPTISLNLDEIYGNSIYEYLGNTYLSGTGFSLNGTLNKPSILNVLINGELIKSINKNGTFEIGIDLNQYLSGKEDSDNLTLQLEAKDNEGNIALSDNIKIIFNKFTSLFLNIILS